MTEIDPLWDDDELSLILNPEAPCRRWIASVAANK
ncbi:hypothetical protein [Vibrio tasmaniensis]